MPSEDTEVKASRPPGRDGAREKPPSKDGTVQRTAKEVEGLKDFVSEIARTQPLVYMGESPALRESRTNWLSGTDRMFHLGQ